MESIRMRVQWAKTSRGGKQFDVLADMIDITSSAARPTGCATMDDNERHNARSELIRWLAERLVADALAEGRITATTEAHEKRSHLRPVLNRPPAGNLHR